MKQTNSIICPICKSEDIKKNNILNNFHQCHYCFSFKNSDYQYNNDNYGIDYDILFNTINIKDYKNPVCLSNDKKIIDEYANSYIFCPNSLDDQNNLSLKNLSPILKNGKIDLLIIPELSYFNINNIFSLQELFSKNIKIFFGIFDPRHILQNPTFYLNKKYIYSLFSISKISNINNYDIYNFLFSEIYILLEIKFQNNEDQKFIQNLQSFWDTHETCKLFTNYEHIL